MQGVVAVRQEPQSRREHRYNNILTPQNTIWDEVKSSAY